MNVTYHVYKEAWWVTLELKTFLLKFRVNMHGWPSTLAPLWSSLMWCGISKCVCGHRSVETVFLEQSFCPIKQINTEEGAQHCELRGCFCQICQHRYQQSHAAWTLVLVQIYSILHTLLKTKTWRNFIFGVLYMLETQSHTHAHTHIYPVAGRAFHA